MSWRWTAEDLRRWRLLVKAVACVLRQARERGQPYKGAIGDLRHALSRTLGAVYPTRDAADLATLREWRTLAETYVRNGPEWRTANLAALQLAQARAVAILGDADEPTPPPAAAAAAAKRLPYRDD